MNKATLVYPFDFHFLPILRHNLLPEGIQIQHLVSPNGWGFSNKDAGTIDYGQAVNKIVSSDFTSKIEECSNLLVTQTDKNIDNELVVFPKIHQAIEMGKNIYCTLELSRAELNLFLEKAACRNVSFKYYCNNLENYEKEREVIHVQAEHKNLDTPIIMVFGLLEQIGKFDIQIRLTQFLRNLGYKVSLLSSRNYGTLFNENSVPGFMFQKDFTEYEKIILFNNYIKFLEEKEKPDVFVLGVPGGLVPVNNKFLNNYGITATELTNAVQPDVSIICSHCENFGEDYFSNLEVVFEHKFSMSKKLFFVDNTFVDFSSHSTEGFDIMKIDHTHLDFSALSHINKNIFSYSNIIALFNTAIDLLADDSDINIA